MQPKINNLNWKVIILGILAIGAVGGFIETFLGNMLGLISFPYKGGLLTGISLGILGGIALAIFKKPYTVMAIGVIAALVRMLIVPIQRVSVTCIANASVAIAFNGIALGAVAYIWNKSLNKNIYSQISTGALGAFASSMLFWSIGMYVAPCKYLLGFAGSPLSWIMTESIIWVAFTAVLLPVGHLIGLKVAEAIEKAKVLRFKPVYAGFIAVFIFFVGMTALVYAL
jgi:hypothetical protein